MAGIKTSPEADLVAYTNNFSTQLNASFASVGCTSIQAAAFAALNTTWVTSYATATAPSTRTRDSIAAKNLAKKSCVASLRQLTGIIQNFPGTTDVLRAQFGITVRKPRTTIGIPTAIPVLEVTRRYGTTVYFRMHDGTARKAKPAGVAGARVYSFIGATPPIDVQLWNFEGQITRSEVQVQFPAATAPGATVWFTAAWYNPRGQVGPGSAPVSTNIAGGSLTLAA